MGDAAQLVALGEQLRLLADMPVSHGGKQVSGGMSIGCALYPRHGQDGVALMRAADTALNDLKAHGRGGVRLYNERLLAVVQGAAAQCDMARQMVRQAEVLPFYQPKVRLADGQVVGYEALLRRAGDTGSDAVRSCQLDQAFADYDLAMRLAEQMHCQVLADLALWRERGLPVLPVAINASPVEFLRDDFAERLLERAQRYDIPPELLEVEITEQVLAERGASYVVRALAKLKQHGVRVALDDFGTGHSSLTHLRDYPIDCLKVDRSFIAAMEAEPAILAIIKAVISLGPSLQLDIVAEGVETDGQRLLLLAAGCGLGQGFLFSPAVSAAAVARRLAERLEALREPLWPSVGVG